MAKGSNKKNKALVKIAQLEAKKRKGILAAIGAFVGLALLIALKLFFQYQMAFEWAASGIASIALFILAIAAAGIAGWGTRMWRKARDEIRLIEQKYKL